MKVLSVVGARPQFIKAAPVSRALATAGHEHIVVHTGQHYDPEMSARFFGEFGMQEPALDLGVGPMTTDEARVERMLRLLEAVLSAEQPDWVLVFGDTNSTLAGALGASAAGVPLAHIEAGLRSFNNAMPEERIRVQVDNVSSLLLCPSDRAAANLKAEGLTAGVHVVGDVMGDAISEVFREEHSAAAARDFYFATVHRSENTDDAGRLGAILAAFDALDLPVRFPVHPRTRRAIERLGHLPARHVSFEEPAGYRETILLERGARAVLTDSGGVQKEAYWVGTPCVTFRDETEWTETVEAGWNVLAGADTARILEAARSARRPAERPPLYGDGRAAERCVALLERGIAGGPEGIAALRKHG